MAVVGPPATAWGDDDRLRYLANITELGGTFRRVEAINFDRRALDEVGFEALRVTVTHSDGTEHARVVAITEHQREVLSSAIEAIVGEAETVLGDQVQAVEIILGLVAEHLLPERGPGKVSQLATIERSGTD